MYNKMFRLPPLDAQNHVAQKEHHLISVGKQIWISGVLEKDSRTLFVALVGGREVHKGMYLSCC